MADLLDLGLSSHALSALTEFLTEQKELDEAFNAMHLAPKNTKAKYNANKSSSSSGTGTPLSADSYDSISESSNSDSEEADAEDEEAEEDEAAAPVFTMKAFKEDWQLSQFWYDDATAQTIGDELVAQAKGGMIACISAPTIFLYLKNLNLPNPLVLLEFDTRFGFFSEFKVYDYNSPLDVEGLEVGGPLRGQAAAVVLDPPFLNEDCFSKSAETVKAFSNEDTKIIVSTGWTIRDVVKSTLSAHIVEFRPRHNGGLANAFRCYLNYNSTSSEFGPSTDPDDGDNDFLDQL